MKRLHKALMISRAAVVVFILTAIWLVSWNQYDAAIVLILLGVASIGVNVRLEHLVSLSAYGDVELSRIWASVARPRHRGRRRHRLHSTQGRIS